MKNPKTVFLALFLLLLLPSLSYSSSLGELRLTLIEGDVQVNSADSADWIPASVNMPLTEEDMLWVPEGGRLELQLRNGTSIRLDQNSSLEILRLEDGTSQFHLTSGSAYVYFKGTGRDVIQIDTPLSSIRGFERSIFKISVTGSGDTDVSVLRGYVDAENRNGRTRVDEDHTLSMRGDAYAELGPIGPPDEWERWNRERNQKVYERRYSSRYIPEELEAYSNDLDENGKWVNVREYGYVWTPTVYVSVGWSPYRHGRWIWRGGDYVWVAYEPWGWAPYHYGRWSYITSIGWCWVPPVRGAVYWGPGFVGWVHTPEYVAWVPLAPGETYYGYGHYGPHSVNVTNINVQNTVINVYKNVHVDNSVTVVHHDTFVKGRHVDVKFKGNPFLTEKINVGRPHIKPEKTTFMPVIKDIPDSKRPPKKIEGIRVREIKKERPLVREQRRSVLRPGASQKDMPVKVLKDREPRVSGEKEPLKKREVGPFERQKRPEVERPRRETGPRMQRPERQRPERPQVREEKRERTPGEIKGPSEQRPKERPSVPVRPQQEPRKGEPQMQRPERPGQSGDRKLERPKESRQPSGVERRQEQKPAASSPRPEPRRSPEREKIKEQPRAKEKAGGSEPKEKDEKDRKTERDTPEEGRGRR